MGEGRVLLLGECNPYGPDPEYALYCYPPNCSGHRLWRILGVSEQQYLALHRKNLCDGDWSADRAKRRAYELLSPQSPWRVMVLLGRKVTGIFEKIALDGVLLEAFSTRVCCPGMNLVALPHPSGQNAGLWNSNARARARQLLRELVPEVPWGAVPEGAVLGEQLRGGGAR